MLLADLVEASRAVRATRSRTAKVRALAGALGQAAPGGPEEIQTATAYLSGALRQRRTGLGWRSLGPQMRPDPATVATLRLDEVDGAFEHIAGLSGPGSQAERAAAVRSLLSRATAPEQDHLVALATGNLRQGALDGLMLEAVSLAAGVDAATVRRAAMLTGTVGPVAVLALTGGAEALAGVRLEVGRPLRPMLASSAPDVADAFARVGRDGAVAVECKLDGVRVQVHRAGDRVSVFSRTLEELTDRVPEVVAAVSALPGGDLVLDGEALALDQQGRPRAFQETAARSAERSSDSEVALTAYFFDLLHRGGQDLLDAPGEERARHLADVVPPEQVVPRVVTDDPGEAEHFLAQMLERGHEGVVVKDPTRGYAAGRRGSAWVKVKPAHTLDLVVLAVEWGSGRRRGWLSNIHLGARDPDQGGFVMLGKTFKGMSDETLAWQTRRFLELETSRSGHVVHLRPEQVVEIACDGLQRSTRYPGGLALRFARVLGYREDKPAGEADTLERVRRLAADGGGTAEG